MANFEPETARFLLLQTVTPDDAAAAESLLGVTCPDGSDLWVLIDPADDPSDRVYGAAVTRQSDPATADLTNHVTRNADPRAWRQLLLALANVLRRRGVRAIEVSLDPELMTYMCLRSMGLRPIGHSPGSVDEGARRSTHRWVLEL